ncbi:hypothetical protein VTL71DRAFT_11228 [Oculimacula yallundae]|uniref:Uncharacterized protein n=1 Tax=Oculimacula yallundae TaxID=86028 RepID=A0ABR4CVP1_9HELO
MFAVTCILLTAVTAAFSAFSLSSEVGLEARDGSCGEKAAKICYGAPSGVAQNVVPEDVAYVAAYLRYYGQSTTPGGMLTMPVTSPFECAEWSIYEAGTALVLAKHIDARVKSSVLFEDIATAIDGGEATFNATNSILNCGTNGGSLGVTADTKRPEYSSPEFITSGAKTTGIAIKIVKAP